MSVKRPIKALLYGAPGVGKSVFSAGLPNPFFICTDGNYEWLLDFGAKEEDHVNISSFAEFEQLCNNDFAGYDTVIVDLLEDIYKWNEAEYCKKQNVDHLSDAGGYGKGWDVTRTRLFVACSKLLALPKNVIFLSHESSYTEKDRRGNEKTKYCASNLMNEKFIVMLEGRLRYFLRCKFKDEVNEDGKVVTHRILSLIPKSDEYGIIRGVDVNLMPEDIELDPQEFLEVTGYTLANKDVVNNEEKKPVSIKPVKVAKPVKQEETPKVSDEDKAAKLAAIKAKTLKKAEAVAPTPAPQPGPQPVPPQPQPVNTPLIQPAPQPEPEPEPVQEPEPQPEPEQKPVPVIKVTETVVEEKVESKPVVPTKEDQAAKIAAIKAKLLAKKGLK